MRLLYVCGRDRSAAKRVDSTSHFFEMGGVATARDATQVVHLQTFRQRTMRKEVRDSMSFDLPRS
jgi:hypothetical protein